MTMKQNETKNRKIYLATPRGFCAGVHRAVKIVDDTLEKAGTPVFVRHDIVHNEFVVKSFRERGVVFVEELTDVQKDRPVIFSAHGVSPDVEKQATDLDLTYIDATCPIVKKIHKKALHLRKEGYKVLLIGHKKHPEVVGTMGYLEESGIVIENREDAEELDLPADIQKITYITQTTLSPDDVAHIVKVLSRRFINLKSPSRSDICYATLERQKAVRTLAEKCKVILVIGSSESSNSKRLVEVAKQAGAEVYLIDTHKDIPENITAYSGDIGITAGASAPEVLVQEVVNSFSDAEVLEL